MSYSMLISHKVGISQSALCSHQAVSNMVILSMGLMDDQVTFLRGRG